MVIYIWSRLLASYQLNMVGKFSSYFYFIYVVYGHHLLREWIKSTSTIFPYIVLKVISAS